MASSGIQRDDEADRSGLLRFALAAVTVTAVVLAVSVALRPQEPLRRRALAQVLGWQIASSLVPAPTSALVDPDTDPSPVRRGTSRGYSRAVVFTEPHTSCDAVRDPVSCGAKLEIFHRGRDAASRARRLRADGAPVVCRGTVVLQFSPAVGRRRQQAYARALDAVIARLHGLRQLTRSTN